MSLRDFVQRYLDEKFGRPHPIPRGEKGPRTGWKDPDKIFNPSDFKEGENVGTQLVDDLIDVDLDCAEAVALAPDFLPPTERIHGRASKRRSHWWYRGEEIGLVVYNDVPRQVPDPEHEGQTKLVSQRLLEVRNGPKFQTMIPPSTHPEGETVEWDVEGPLGAVEKDPFALAHRLLATATLLARSWPTGNRHVAALHVAGFLAARGVDQETVEHLITAVCRVAHDDEPTDRLKAVEDSFRAFAGGGKTSGGPSLAEATSKDVLSRLIKWWGKDDADVKVGDFVLTETGDATVFAGFAADIARFHFPREQWFILERTTGIWKPDAVKRAKEMAKSLMAFQRKAADKIADPDARKKVYSWYHAGDSRTRLNNMLDLAQSVEPLANDGTGWDEDPFLLGCRNGVVNLRTGELRTGLPNEHVSMRVAVAYDPTATAPLWEATLKAIFAPGEEFDEAAAIELQAFFQRALGYSITGDCSEECCFFAWGGGGNGKGTTLNTVGKLLGDYRDDMPYSTLEKAQHGSGIPSDVAKLAGKRFVTCSEMNEFKLNESRLKALTGRDPMTARFLHKDFFTFEPVSKIWLATNNRPKVTGTDDGIWRRIHLIPFLRKFEGANRNLALKDQLVAERPGILVWLVKGVQLWLERRLDPPAVVKAATEEYRNESNPITPFVESCCVVLDGVKVQAQPLFDAYQRWCQDGHVDHLFRLSDKQFHAAMKLRFQATERVRIPGAGDRKAVFYIGVALREERNGPSGAGPESGARDGHNLPF